MILQNCNRQLVLTALILCFVKYEWKHLQASPHNYEHDGLLRMLQVRAATSPHINVAHDHQHFKVGETEPPKGSPDYDARDSHPLKVGAQERRQTTSPRRSTTSHKSKRRTISRKSKKEIIYAALGIGIFALLLVLLLLSISTCRICRRKRGRGNDVELQAIEVQLKKCEKFNFRTIVGATQAFSSENKLGEGGYGPVYKGTLADGREIAVKRLKSTSRSGQGQVQGTTQFINEVNSITRLLHRNIVQLLGYCFEEGERLLIYEFIPNKSLDVHLFGDSIDNPVGLLLWRERKIIIIGIAQGLVYLHAYSHFKIIHRDIKPSNILLDHELNPKISDFGLARLFGDDQIVANTNRPDGTYGYMAPEYCIGGVISPKLDVYSFGVVLLEIISGKENGEFLRERGYGLLIYIWELWRVGRPLELVDEAVVESCDNDQNLVIRFINIGLLCVQESAEDRPSMSDVVHMLESTVNIPLPVPKEPPCYGDRPNLEA